MLVLVGVRFALAGVRFALVQGRSELIRVVSELVRAVIVTISIPVHTESMQGQVRRQAETRRPRAGSLPGFGMRGGVSR